LNKSLYNKNEKKRLQDDEAGYARDFMIEVNANNLTPQSWSLRDINKIFLRLKNQKKLKNQFINVSTAVNLLFYALSSASESTPEEKKKESSDKLIELLQNIFKDKTNNEDLKKAFNEKAELVKE